MEHESFSSLFRIDTIDRETKRKTERERTLRMESWTKKVFLTLF